MSLGNASRWIVVVGVVALVAVSASFALAGAGGKTVTDGRKDTRALKDRPEIDIVKASAVDAVGSRVKHKIKMRGKLTPSKNNTRPFILINTKGSKTSDFEYLVLGARVFEKKGKKFNKVGANQFVARKRTWIYRFKPKKIGVTDSYDWAALTAKGKATDLAPNKRYTTHRIGK